MKIQVDVQFIFQDGEPKFAVIPYYQYLALTNWNDKDAEGFIPQEVRELQSRKKISLLAAWRVYKGVSQKELAQRLGVSPSAVAQVERVGGSPQKKTLQRIAAVLDLRVAQLVDN
ncbi:TPA: helix-turn-helix transcriptional regulator [Aeromonas hydrophila]|uniref:helix-turn-helix domain-containing protein n=1 Tax=Aeromonas hydrophila TaxID=644 RepID=UPI0021E8FABA|nr:helix-turn-helix transcriptional regulator [Aeromonas hydrophila]MCV3295480.1 helix-turn-helix domain-containing protein [Aeromonas hydrophila]